MSDFWGAFLQSLGGGVSQAGQTIAGGVREQAQFDLQRELEREREQRAMQREEDQEAYKRLQAKIKTMQQFAGQEGIQGTPLGDYLNEAITTASAQGIEGASQFDNEFAERLFGQQQQAQQARGGVRGGIFPGPGSPEAQPQGPGPMNVDQLISTAGARSQELADAEQWQNISLESALQTLSSPGLDDSFKRAFAAGYLQNAGDRIPDALRASFETFAQTSAAQITPQALNAMTPQDIALRFGRFINPDGSLTEDAPPVLSQYQGDLASIARQGQQEISFSNQMNDLGVQGASLEVQRGIVGLDQDRLTLEESRKEGFRNARRFYLETQLTGAQIDQVNQAIDQSGVRFDREERQAAAANVLAAAEAGYDGNLSQQERSALASYLGVRPGSPEYQARLDEIAQENLSMAAAVRERAHIDNSAARLGIDIQQQQLNAAEYAQARTLLEDGRTDAALAWNAARNGDTGLLDTYLSYLENPEAFPEQAASLEEAGLTAETVRGWRERATNVLSSEDQARELQTQLVREQVQGLATANEDAMLARGRSIAQSFETVEEFEAFLADPQNAGIARTLSQNPLALSSARAAVRMNSVMAAEADAWRDFQAVSAIRPASPEQTEAALTTMRSSLETAGVSPDVATAITEGYRSAWARDANEFQLAALESQAKLQLVRAQTSAQAASAEDSRANAEQRRAAAEKARAEGRALDAGTHPDQLQAAADAAAEERQRLSDIRQTITSRLVAQGCIPSGDPSSFEALIASSAWRETLPAEQVQACDTTASGYLDVQAAQAAWTSLDDTFTRDNLDSGAETQSGPGRTTPQSVTIPPGAVEAARARFAAGATEQQVRDQLRAAGASDALIGAILNKARPPR